MDVRLAPTDVGRILRTFKIKKNVEVQTMAKSLFEELTVKERENLQIRKASHAPLRDYLIPYPALNCTRRRRFPSANASLPYFAVISAFLFLNHFPFLLKSIKIAVMNISLIFTNRNAITAITFFCYSVSVKLFLLSIYFSITAILFCRKFQTGHAINSPVS